MIDEMGLVGERGAATSKYFQASLAELNNHPLVGQTRGIGMLGALEIVKDKTTKEKFTTDGAAGVACRGHCFASGVVMRAVGDTMFLSPPLVITNDEIDELFQKVRQALDLTAAEMNA
jgi:putrescine aminotransferase